jgi:hypothetical protein
MKTERSASSPSSPSTAGNIEMLKIRTVLSCAHGSFHPRVRDYPDRMGKHQRRGEFRLTQARQFAKPETQKQLETPAEQLLPANIS